VLVVKGIFEAFDAGRHERFISVVGGICLSRAPPWSMFDQIVRTSAPQPCAQREPDAINISPHRFNQTLSPKRTVMVDRDHAFFTFVITPPSHHDPRIQPKRDQRCLVPHLMTIEVSCCLTVVLQPTLFRCYSQFRLQFNSPAQWFTQSTRHNGDHRWQRKGSTIIT
jgi:hypothetical protein